MQRDYPYMYARISAKRAKLLDEDDYENFLKLGPNEIARKLEEGEYKEDINDLGAEHDGVELVELALMRNVSRIMSDLIDIAPEELEGLITVFLRRYDILSLKRLIRWKKGGQENNIHSFLLPVGSYSFEELEDLAEKDLEEICKAAAFKDSEVDYQSYIDPKDDIRKIEKNLDNAYYDELEKMAEKVESVWFKRFVKQEIEYENLKIALRLKKSGADEDQIREWLVSGDGTKLVEEVITASRFDEAIDAVQESEELELEQETLEEVEHSLERARLDRALTTLHTEPLGITSIFGYIVAKLIEVRNLRILIRAKETEIQNLETIRKNLVIA